MEKFDDKVTDIKPYIKGLFQDPILFSRLMNRIPVSLAIFDTNMRTVFLNRSLEALTGFSSEQVRGIPCKHILRTNMCGKKCPIHSMGADSEPVCVEGDIINRNREKIPVRVSVAPITDESGYLSGWLESFEDLRILRSRETEQAA
ncbi:MAG TPA: PAS domain-containing protein, partial [Desulfohalobiaceae bacterium]|nr:PAS domain-containing protein [Desulfohalobiaceae bacterium]